MADIHSETPKIIAVADQEAASMQSGDMSTYLTILCEDACTCLPTLRRSKARNCAGGCENSLTPTRSSGPGSSTERR